MTRRPGPVPREYWGCTRACFEQNEHTAVWPNCTKASPPPCEHPTDSIGWNPVLCAVICRSCGQEITLRALAEQAQVALSMGCRCPTDFCLGTCGSGRPLGWTLDPAKILAYVAAEEEGVRESRSLMLSLPVAQWEPLLEAARERRTTPERFCRSAVLRRIREFSRFRD